MIPEKAQGKVKQAIVVAVGPGAKNKVQNDIIIIFDIMDFIGRYYGTSEC